MKVFRQIGVAGGEEGGARATGVEAGADLFGQLPCDHAGGEAVEGGGEFVGEEEVGV